MMRLCAFGVAFAILLAGGAYGGYVRPLTLNEGSSYTFSVMTIAHDVITCHLDTPHGSTIDFVPGNVSSTTYKYQVEPGTPGIADCMLTLNNIDENDEGIWMMYYDHAGVDGRNETYQLTVNVTQTTSLSEINHFTVQDKLIDISLNQESFEEECYVQPPNGTMTKSDLLAMENVTIQKNSSFVSCRITIGPMTEDLLGKWRVCGMSIENGEMRCRTANIAWNNNNPITPWHSDTKDKVDHPVHFGGNVNPGVAGIGDIITCHVITPNGEDLVLTSDIKYPHIERIALNSASLCSIVFKDIDSSMLGDWVIYGKFRALTMGLNEVRLPLNFFLYNAENPYEQAYNVTVLHETRHVIILGTPLNMEVVGVGEVDDCQFRMPSGQTFDLNSTKTTEGITFKSLDSAVACQIVIDSITEEMFGEWQIVGKFSNANLFSEKRQTFQIIQEDPTNPIIDEYRVVENMTELIVDTKLGESHRFTINYTGFVDNESCHLMTPNGLQYAFILGFNVTNVEIIEESWVECGVVVNVLTPDMLGEWTLIARATRLSVPIERRLTFTIRVEETFSLNPINIAQGADLYVRLPDATYMYDTCKLYGPHDEEITDFEVDYYYHYSCGYIIRKVYSNHSGKWAIVYGNQVTYRANFEVNVIETVGDIVESPTWTAGTSVNQTIGPEDAVYCRVENVHGSTVFDGFGPCRIVLDRVTINEMGLWRIFIALPGSVTLQEHEFYVTVRNADSNPVVTTSVVRVAPSVMLTCSVPAEYDVKACKFRDPRGTTLVASHGVGQDGYTFETNNYESIAESHNCTLRLTNPTSQDLGLWRCGVDTEQDTFFGFITVTCPWLMQNETIAASVVTEPVLKQDKDAIVAVEGSVTMSCSINSAIRYCYFRRSNGTVFNVGPAISSPDFEYVGDGFDAGDCGIRFNNLLATDRGNWTCHVGLINRTANEQRASFSVEVTEPVSLSHYWEDPHVLVLSAHFADWDTLEYCRFVRIDGLGITSDNTYSDYNVQLTHQGCLLRIHDPTILEMHPWSVAAKLVGHDGERSRSLTVMLLPPSTIVSEISSIFSGVWIFVMILGFVLLAIGLALSTKKNRKWTRDRASRINNSLRNSFRKQPLPADILTVPPKQETPAANSFA